MLVLGSAVAAAVACRPSPAERSEPPPPPAVPTPTPPVIDATPKTDGPSGSAPEASHAMTENELNTNGYLIDVSGLPVASAAVWRSRVWLLAMVTWGRRTRLLEVARAVAAETPAASAWVAFTQGDEQVLLVMSTGEAKVGPVGDVPAQLAKTYALDASHAEAAKLSLLEYEHPGMELAHGAVGEAKRFDSALLQQGSLTGVEINSFRIEGNQYLTPDDLARLEERAAATGSSVSATLHATYLRVRTGLLEGTIPARTSCRAGRVFMSLSPWFSYELRGIAEGQDRSQGWVIHRIVARGLP